MSKIAAIFGLMSILFATHSFSSDGDTQQSVQNEISVKIKFMGLDKESRIEEVLNIIRSLGIQVPSEGVVLQTSRLVKVSNGESIGELILRHRAKACVTVNVACVEMIKRLSPRYSFEINTDTAMISINDINFDGYIRIPASEILYEIKVKNKLDAFAVVGVVEAYKTSYKFNYVPQKNLPVINARSSLYLMND